MSHISSAHPVPAARRAIVMGGSMAGLLAARILVERFDQVVLLERDDLPEHPGPRKGTPHAVQPHGLLAKGCEVLESLFPGFTQALVAQGALVGDIGRDVVVDAGGCRLARGPIGIAGLAVSRLAIEAELRRRMRADPRVELRTGVDVVSPVHEEGRVSGVRWRAQEPGAPVSTLHGALVVDCTGRGSHSPSWLREWGYEPPAEERVQVGLAYTSAYFVRASAQPEVAVVIGATTPQMPRPSILIAQEPDAQGRPRWVAGVGGYAGDHVEPTREAMAQRARITGQAEIAALAASAELIGPVVRFGFPHSQRRHYERLRRFPQGYLAMGDALASFNPVYGQGMTVAACQALALRDALARGTDGLAHRFFKAASHVIDGPWQLAVGADLALPQVPGPRPFPMRQINAYVGRVQRVAATDRVVAEAFIRVMHLLAQPPSLFAPRILWRVWRGGRAAAAPVQAAVVG